LPSTAQVKEIAAKLYDVETRPELVAQGLTVIGAQKLLDEKALAVVASLSTYAGLIENKTALQELAAPYIEKAYNKEGRKELVSEAVDLASEKVIKPTKELAAPYVAPYVAKLESKRAEIVGSKRYEKAVSALQSVREHPMEMATELRSKAIDLLKYENLASYREYVLSDAFQADTRRLIQVDLPSIASDAASRGVEKVKTGATVLASELEAKYLQISDALERSKAAVKKIELDDLRARAKMLLNELQTEVAEGVQHARSDGFSLSDAMSRMKKVFAAIDSIFIAPGMSALKLPEEKTEAEAPAEAMPDEIVAEPLDGEAEADAADEAETEAVPEAPAEPAEAPVAEVEQAPPLADEPSAGVTTDFNKAMDALGPI